jgi:hypothetical protein
MSQRETMILMKTICCSLNRLWICKLKLQGTTFSRGWTPTKDSTKLGPNNPKAPSSWNKSHDLSSKRTFIIQKTIINLKLSKSKTITNQFLKTKHSRLSRIFWDFVWSSCYYPSSQLWTFYSKHFKATRMLWSSTGKRNMKTHRSS